MARRQRRVFINCPFDPLYWPLFEVLVFTVIACGLQPSSALAEVDGGATRITKIMRLIGQAEFGIHDLSRIGLEGSSQLPRFNMPFELGLDLGCRRFGTRVQRRKKILILDSVRFRYQAFISDIAGQDIHSHGDDTSRLFKIVREFLSANLPMQEVPGQSNLRSEFHAFAEALPALCARTGLEREALAFPDFVRLATAWIKLARKEKRQ